MTGSTTQFVLIVGASTRAAAQSAVRAGLRPICADLFADEDLRAFATVLPLERYPHALPDAARAAPACPWLYTGALENHPSIIATLSAARPLLGNDADVVVSVRNPFALHAVLMSAGLPALDVRRWDDPPPCDGRWLIKPRRGAAGRGIHVWDEATAASRKPDASHYFQRWADGAAVSALYVGTGDDALFVGATRQLIGEPALHARPFQYCGSIGPLSATAPDSPGRAGGVSPPVRRTSADSQFEPAGLHRPLAEPTFEHAEEIGRAIAARFGLRGLFGCDFIADGSCVWLTEVNPRYTASVEIYEVAWGLPLLRWHRAACEASDEGNAASVAAGFGPELTSADRSWRVAAKAILYAPRDLVAPPLGPFEFEARECDPLAPQLADIPRPGSSISTGHPVCTVLATGPTEPECRAVLSERIERLSQKLFGGCGTVSWQHAKSSSRSA